MKKVLILLLVVLVSACQHRTVYGVWEGKDHNLVINRDSFEIEYHNSEIDKIRGILVLSSDQMKMVFREYLEGDQWNSLEGTELYNQYDVLLFSLNDNFLTTRNTAGMTMDFLRKGSQND